MGLDFRRDGMAHFPAVLSREDLDLLQALADARIGARPGARVGNEPRLAALLAPTGVIGELAARLTSVAAQPVRAVLFDKTVETNWSVAWHQDRTITVRERIEVKGFGPWSTKDGVLHVAPPVDLLARMVTLRVHLDPVGATNAPLRAARGSHRLGRVSADTVGERVQAHVIETCLAEVGDVWAYSTLILHASDRADPPARRRVLQVDYGDFALPAGLEWLGVGAL